jgi:uncharacterized repeat protein (TIGR03803 family)
MVIRITTSTLLKGGFMRSARKWLLVNSQRLRKLGVFVSLCLGAALTAPAYAQNYTVLYSFQCGPDDGEGPTSGPIRDSAGNLYGVTDVGGSTGYGTIYELLAVGSEVVLHNFMGPPSDGGNPVGAPALDSTGNLYGTTAFGGRYGLGSLFTLTPDGVESTLHSFGLGADGSEPYSGLTIDASDNVYGTTTLGGGGYDGGTVFKALPSGTEFTLHSFGRPGDGSLPMGTPVLGSGNQIFGTTEKGGAHGAGAIFELTSGIETLPYNFAGGQSGASPEAGVVRDSKGNLFGTTGSGGVNGYGTVFEVNSTGKHQVLYSFGGPPDGANPYGGVVRDSADNLYGVTFFGGSGPCNNGFGGIGCGTIYEVTRSGQESLLYSFEGAPDGEYPVGNLVRDGAGDFYGATEEGGTYGCGTVFEYTP